MALSSPFPTVVASSATFGCPLRLPALPPLLTDSRELFLLAIVVLQVARGTVGPRSWGHAISTPIGSLGPCLSSLPLPYPFSVSLSTAPSFSRSKSSIRKDCTASTITMRRKSSLPLARRSRAG
ncbi:unnamed protein product [Musa acuminata subsp. burmannicoides]